MNKKIRILLTGLFVFLPTIAFGSIYTGSGFFISQDGYFVTNYHVVRESSEIQLRDLKGNLHAAKLIRTDKANDLAILKASGSFSALPIANSRGVKRGMSVITVGYPHIDVQGLEPKITEGIVNSLSGIGDDPRVFQISVPVQSGNSGGPLVTNEGNVVGVVVSKLSAGIMFKETGDMPQNVNYAVKSNYLLEVIANIPELDPKLSRVNAKKLGNLSELTAYVEKATAIVIAKGAGTTTNQPVKPFSPQPNLRVTDFPDTGILSPYIKGESVTPGNVNTALNEVEARLRSGGFSVIGKYQPQGIYGSGVVVVTDQAILDIIAEVGGDVIVGAAIRVGVKADGTVTYMNPEYWYRAYFRGKYDNYAAVVKGMEIRLKRTLGATIQLGGGLEVSKLAGFRFMPVMESFVDNRDLATHASFESAVEAVRANLANGTGGTAKVYEVVMPQKKIAVFGVAMNDPNTGEGMWVNKIEGTDQIAALPYEVFVVGDKTMGFFARYRLPLGWPMLKMQTFGKIMSTPANIRATLKAVAGGY